THSVPDHVDHLANILDELVCEPIELLAIATVERKRHQHVEHLRRREPAQLPPDRNPRRGRLARKAIRQQHPLRPGMRRISNHGFDAQLIAPRAKAQNMGKQSRQKRARRLAPPPPVGRQSSSVRARRWWLALAATLALGGAAAGLTVALSSRSTAAAISYGP